MVVACYCIEQIEALLNTFAAMTGYDFGVATLWPQTVKGDSFLGMHYIIGVGGVTPETVMSWSFTKIVAEIGQVSLKNATDF